MNSEMNRDRTSRRPTWLIGPIVAAVGVALLLGGASGRTTTPARTVPVALKLRPIATEGAPAPGSTPRTKAIEEVRVGDRVLAGNPEGSVDEPDVVPSSWVRIALTLVQPDDVVEIVLLRPRDWADAMGARPGATIPLDLVELGASGPASVTEVGLCPPIKVGAGRIVIGTFRHRSARVFDLAIEGESETIGVTSSHPFWSEDRGQFVKAGELVQGERLRALRGQARVASLTPRSSSHEVYNIEVQGDHVYRVAGAGILVHNSGCGPTVYQSVDNAGNVLYVGKANTGGLGTNTLAQRLAAAEAKTGFPAAPIPNLGKLTVEEAEAVEAFLIKHLGTVKSKTGILVNKIFPKRGRPNYQDILDLGKSILQRAGYPGV